MLSSVVVVAVVSVSAAATAVALGVLGLLTGRRAAGSGVLLRSGIEETDDAVDDFSVPSRT